MTPGATARAAVAETSAATPTPPESPLAMPAQDLRAAHRVRFPPRSLRTHAARLAAFGGAAVLTLLGWREMTLVFGPESVTPLQLVLQTLFVVTFGWIAFSATSTLAGVLFPPRPPRLPPDAPAIARSAIVMPIYNEDAATCFGALAAIGAGLAEAGEADRFEVFVISDTRDPDRWAGETTAYAALRDELEPLGISTWYRRRARNLGRKAGNVQDFVERWGGRYDFMLVLDADSLMDPATIIEMVRRMESAPKLALVQSAPALAGGETPFARLQQFAGALYGRPIARGVAAWQGPDGNFWGHNALIRTRAFAEAAGLPELRGRRPFGGHILSHDFVEAALLRRAGWEVRMDPDLEGSWEGSPPSLLAASVRDRRWAQGNLQHLAVIGARGLRWPNRAHFAIGVGAYMMSPIWLAMIVVGLILTAQAIYYRPEYFPDTFQLFPEWPRFDAVRMTWLFAVSMGLLLLPKAIGLVEALTHHRRRRRLGGGLRVTAGALTEILLSALAAPISMLLQSRHVAEILLGRDSGWAPQERGGAALPWRAALKAHGGHAAAGLVCAVAVWFAQPELLIWLSPVLLGLVLAPALSRFSGDPRAGRLLSSVGLLDAPEDRETPPIEAAAAAARERLRSRSAGGLVDLAARPELLEAHLSALARTGRDAVSPSDEQAFLARLTARAKLSAASTARQALGWMTPAERAAIAGEPELITALAARG